MDVLKFSVLFAEVSIFVRMGAAQSRIAQQMCPCKQVLMRAVSTVASKRIWRTVRTGLL